MERVTGIGGLFFRAKDPAALGEWYRDALGIDLVPTDYGQKPWSQEAGPTVFAPFANDTDYFGNAEKQWMINFRVRNLDTMVEQLRAMKIEIRVDAAGVDYAVIVHPEPYQDDHRYLEYCFEVGKSRFKGTCLFFADQPESMARMPDLVKRLPIVAARVHAYAPDRLPPFGKPAMRELWKVAGAYGLAVQLHFEPRHAPGFEPLIKEFPDVKVVIDHLGRPFQGTPDEHEVVIRWSRFQNTVIKLSAIPSPTTYPHRDIGPVIKRLAQEFGPDRMIYGGGFNAEATGTTYRAAIEKARSHVGFLSGRDQAKVFGENAARLFGFKRS